MTLQFALHKFFAGKLIASGAAIALLSGAAPAQTLKLDIGKRHGKVQASAHVQVGHVNIAFGNAGGVRGIRESVYGANCYKYQIYVPGHYVTRYEQVYIPGCWRDVWVDAVYEWRRDACGNYIKVCVRAGYWTKVQDPGRYETREVQVWVPGRYEYR
ncbi:MAG: hypothetical protein ACKVS6_10340 [Planctomycetota bacterium]